MGSMDAERAMSTIKSNTTKPMMDFEEKNEKKYEAPNLISYIINTNVNVLADDRRIAIFDISSKYKGNHQYFNELNKKCFNRKCGEAFYAYMIEHENQKWYEYPVPESFSKQIMRNSNIHPVYDYLKTYYLITHKDINMTYKELNKAIEDSDIGCRLKNGLGRGKLRQLLNQIDIEVVKGHANVMFVKCTHRKLHDIFTKRKWIDDEDEYENPYKDAEGECEPDEKPKEKPKKKKDAEGECKHDKKKDEYKDGGYYKPTNDELDDSIAKAIGEAFKTKPIKGEWKKSNPKELPDDCFEDAEGKPKIKGKPKVKGSDRYVSHSIFTKEDYDMNAGTLYL
jgi:hypothetical protein